MDTTAKHHAIAESWRASSVGKFHWKSWNDSDEVVLYFSGSGDTYLLNKLGYLILNQLSMSSKSKDELIQVLNTLIEKPDEVMPFPEEMIEAHLFHFKKIGLIES